MVKIPKIEVLLEADCAPVKEVVLNSGSPQAYRVVAGTITLPPFTGVISNGNPLQIIVLYAVITGVGFTYTVKVKDE